MAFFYLHPIIIPDLGAKDNGGLISVESVPYMINATAMPDKNITLTFKAEDTEGNVGNCIFEIQGKLF